MDAGDEDGAVDDSEGVRGSDDPARLDRLRKLLDSAKEAPEGDPIEPDAADLTPEEVDDLDLDGDQEVQPWEIERARRRLERAELHPLKNDLGDGEYPIERGEYRRLESEFDAVDTNGDDLIEVDEYYEFLGEVDQITLLLDRNGDREISRDESRLSEGEFAPLDLDDSGSLKPWEIRRAVALGALD